MKNVITLGILKRMIKKKYLCHSCGWDSQQQEYDYAAFDSWQEKMGLNERSKGKLRPADLLRRKAKMAGKRKLQEEEKGL